MNKKQKAVYIYFIILPFLDLITSLITRFTDMSLSLGMIIKGITLMFSIVYILFCSKSKYRKKSIIYLIVLSIFMLFYLGTKSDIWTLECIINEVVYAFRYFYFPLMILGVLNIFNDFKIDNNFIKRILLINCIIYTFLLIVPYITGTSFNSYRYNNVFGTNGWFYAANETGVITVILLCSIIYFLDIKKKWKVLLTIPILLSIAIIGTKVSYLGMIIVTIMVAVYFIIKNKKEYFVLPLTLILILMAVCNFSPTYENLQGSIDRVSNTEETEKDTNNTINDIVSNKNIAKIITVALNGREEFFLKNYNIYSNSDVIDKLFGLSWSNRSKINYTFEKKLVEIDYLDIFLHYGIIGFIVYFLPLIYFLIKVLKNIKAATTEARFYLLVLLLALAISCFAGHVLAAPSVSIYLILLIAIIDNDLKKTKQLKDKEITIMSLHLGYGGIEQYLSSLCKMLENDYKINIISTYKISNKPALYFSDKIKITYLIDDKPNREEIKKALANKNILSIFKEGLKSIKILYLKKNKNIKAIKNIDSKYIITTRDFHNKLVGTYADENIVKIATEHNYHNNDKKYIKAVINSIKNFDYLVVVSNNLKEFYQDKIGQTKCIYISNTIDKLPDKESNLKYNNIINIGRLETVKGQLELIDIVKEVKKQIKDIKLYLIGDGSLRKKLEEKVKENNLEDNVIFTGFIDKDKMEEYLVKSKLFVMTSYSESFGLVLIEAMSYKVPCIAYDSADGPRQLLKDDVGILIKERNQNLMIKEIVKLLKDDKLLKKYSNNGYKKCQKYLSNNIKKEWLKILK